MRVVLADTRGFCFGVRDALEIAETIPQPDQVAIFGQLVHNPQINNHLQQLGFSTVSESNRNEIENRPVVLITAHGISDRQRHALIDQGRTLVDTTCPLVRRAHEAAQRLAAEGRHVLIFGRNDHVEVQGIAQDLDSVTIVPSIDAVTRYDSKRLGIVAQTTSQLDEIQPFLERVRQSNPDADVRYIDTVCQPTKDRQIAVEKLLDEVEAVVVVGGRNSNNTRQLTQVCQRRGKPAYQVEEAHELRPEWFDGIRVVGLTAGASTPDDVIDAVHSMLLKIETRSEPCRPAGAA